MLNTMELTSPFISTAPDYGIKSQAQPIKREILQGLHDMLHSCLLMATYQHELGLETNIKHK